MMRPGQGNRRNNNRRSGGHGGHGGHGGGHGGNHGGSHGGGGHHGGNRPRSAASLRNQIFDSNGPDTRVRGNAFQVHEKYLALAKDALSSGDRVLAENYLQHAEHYYRIIEAINEATAAEQRARQAAFAPQAGEQPQPMANGFYSDMAGGAPAQTPLGSLNSPMVDGAAQDIGDEGDEAQDAPMMPEQAAAGGRR